jgi:hypothetical protein
MDELTICQMCHGPDHSTTGICDRCWERMKQQDRNQRGDADVR